MLTYKRKLILTKAQEERINQWIGCCRFVYNMCIEIQKAAWRNKQTYIHRFDLIKQITPIRDIKWVEDVPIDSLQSSVERVDKAYKSFFKGNGYPRFAHKGSYNSITFKQNIKAGIGFIEIPKIRRLKIFKDSRIIGKIKIITIKKEPTGYFACIVTDAIKSIQCHDENQVIGVDVGIKHFAVGSNGSFISNPSHFKRYERQLRIENRSLSRKKKGSRNWLKQAKKLSILHHKIGNVRNDFLHKRSTAIAEANHTVFIEDLNIAGMTKNRNLSKHILDCGWGIFRRMLEYKTNVVAIDPKYTSQTCFHCGHKDAASRVSQAKFKCTNCGNEMNADHNAALTILSKGIAHLAQRKAIA